MPTVRTRGYDAAMRHKPILLIHGGAGSLKPRGEKYETRRASLEKILASVYPRLLGGGSALDAVTLAVERLEDDPLYNAGLGSKIQGDGKIRMCASIMDGDRRRFAGCVNVERVKNPVRLARRLLGKPDRVLSPPGAEKFARASKLAFASPYTAERIAEYRAKGRGKTGTVGAVALDGAGRLAAATSTGGRGLEYPGRVSDTPTVAANFANRSCALSATGVGEDIIDFGVAAGLCTLIASGRALDREAHAMLTEAKKARAEFGFIALDGKGRPFAGTATAHLIWAMASEREYVIHP